MAYLKFNPDLVKAQPGSMSHTVEFRGQLVRWTESNYPDIDFPREFILREKMLREKVGVYNRDGTLKDNIARFVVCGKPVAPALPEPSEEEVEALERAEILAGLGEDEPKHQPVRVEHVSTLTLDSNGDRDDEMPHAPESHAGRTPRAPRTPKTHGA